MTHFICATCGTQYPDSDSPPASCPICQDERQYVGHEGQQWTTLEELQATHKNVFKEAEPNLIGIGTEPRFAIGQRGLLVQSTEGNVLWDCISLLDDETIAKVNDLGGIDKIAISHPHFYSSMVKWSEAFDAPIYIHADNKAWVMRPHPAIEFWEGETLQLNSTMTIIRTGGHFDGSQLLHWADGAEGRGVLLTGDTINVVADRRYVSFMYSYPNQIPLSPSAVRKIVDSVKPFAYDRIYNGWFGGVLKENAQHGVTYSAQRYIDAICL
jgi:hypothetical protein